MERDYEDIDEIDEEKLNPFGGAIALALEAALFSFLAPSFFTLGNFFEITRLSTELGLLAIAMTPVLITGGIDLSVGAMMGLSAVVLGAAWHDWHVPFPAAVLGAMLVGAAGGSVLNAELLVAERCV